MAHLGHDVAQPGDLALEVVALALQGAQLDVAAARLQGLAGVLGGLADDRLAPERVGDRFEHLALEARRGEPPAAAAVVPLVAVPAAALGRCEDPREQVVAVSHAGGAFARDVREHRFGLGVGDQRLVRVALDDPLRARPALGAAFVAAGADALGTLHVPDGVPGVGQGLPLDADQRGAAQGQADLADQARARQARGAALQVARDRRRVGRWHQARLRHRRAVAHRACGHRLERVAERRAAARPEPLAHVLGHAGEAFLAGHVRMDVVDQLVDVRCDQVAERVRLRDLGEDDAHAAPAALVAEDAGEVHVAREARGIEHEQHRPAAIGAGHVEQQLPEAGARPVVRRLDRVGVLLGDRQAAFSGELEQLAALGVDRDVVAVLRAAQVEGAAVRVRHGRG